VVSQVGSPKALERADEGLKTLHEGAVGAGAVLACHEVGVSRRKTQINLFVRGSGALLPLVSMHVHAEVGWRAEA